MSEIWKEIYGYEGLYEVSTKGNVRSLNRYVDHYKGGKSLKNGKLVTIFKYRSGYCYVNLSKNGKNKKYKVHRLVANAFIVGKKEEINHIDFNKENNFVNNLEWCTRKENMDHSLNAGRFRNTNAVIYPKKAHKLKPDKIIAIREMKLEGFTNQVIADKFAICNQMVSLILNKKRWGSV